MEDLGEIVVLDRDEAFMFCAGVLDRANFEAAHAEWVARSPLTAAGNYALVARHAWQRMSAEVRPDADPREMLAAVRREYKAVNLAVLYVRSRVPSFEPMHEQFPTASRAVRAILTGDEAEVAAVSLGGELQSLARTTVDWLENYDTRAAGLCLYAQVARRAPLVGDAALVAELQVAVNRALMEDMSNVHPSLIARAVGVKSRSMLPTDRRFLDRFKALAAYTSECFVVLVEHWANGRSESENTLTAPDVADLAGIAVGILREKAPHHADFAMVLLVQVLLRRVDRDRLSAAHYADAVALLRAQPTGEGASEEPAHEQAWARAEVIAAMVLALGRAAPDAEAAALLRAAPERDSPVVQVALAVLADEPARFAASLDSPVWGARSTFFAMLLPMLAGRASFEEAAARHPAVLRNALRSRRVDLFSDDLLEMAARGPLRAALRGHERLVPALARYSGVDPKVLALARDMRRRGELLLRDASHLRAFFDSTSMAAKLGLEVLQVTQHAGQKELSAAFAAAVRHGLVREESHLSALLRILRESPHARLQIREYASTFGVLCGPHSRMRHTVPFAEYLPAGCPADVATLLHGMMRAPEAWDVGAEILARGWEGPRGDKIFDGDCGEYPPRAPPPPDGRRVKLTHGCLDAAQLAARCRYFAALFRPGAPWRDRDERISFGGSERAFEVFAQIVETDEVPRGSLEAALELLPLADLYQSDRALRWCEMRLLESLCHNQQLIGRRVGILIPRLPFLHAGFRVLGKEALQFLS